MELIYEEESHVIYYFHIQKMITSNSKRAQLVSNKTQCEQQNLYSENSTGCADNL